MACGVGYSKGELPLLVLNNINCSSYIKIDVVSPKKRTLQTPNPILKPIQGPTTAPYQNLKSVSLHHIPAALNAP